jgi:hypothetical protein
MGKGEGGRGGVGVGLGKISPLPTQLRENVCKLLKTAGNSLTGFGTKISQKTTDRIWGQTITRSGQQR